MTTHADSSDILTGGAWVVVRGVSRWVADEPVEDAEPTLTITPSALDLIACPYCNAKVTESCKNSSGRRREPHKDRLTRRLCQCGAIPAMWKTYCEPCRVKARDRSLRGRERRRVAKARKAKLAAVLNERFGEVA